MTAATITPLTSRRPTSYTTPPAHHVGSPPASFENPWPSYTHDSVFQLIRKSRSTPKNFVPIPTDRKGLVEVRTPDWGTGRKGLKATWIGHASFLVETPAPPGAERGIRILLDPVWSQRMGPFGIVGPVRFTPGDLFLMSLPVLAPCTLEELPWVDAVCISHSHYDHLDSYTLKDLMAKQNGDIHFFCPLNLEATLVGLGAGIEPTQVSELDWWDSIRIEKPSIGSVDLVCTPAQHTSGRTPWDFRKTLWCSWIIQEPPQPANAEPSSPTTAPKKLFFAGDTGYCHVSHDNQPSHHSAPTPPCPAFAEIGSLHGPFDLALLPIGCFLPRSLLSSQHSSPHDAVAMHVDIRSRKSIGMHYGTIRGGLSQGYEPVLEPMERFKAAVEEAGLRWGVEAGLCDVGETVVV